MVCVSVCEVLYNDDLCLYCEFAKATFNRDREKEREIEIKRERERVREPHDYNDIYCYVNIVHISMMIKIVGAVELWRWSKVEMVEVVALCTRVFTYHIISIGG